MSNSGNFYLIGDDAQAAADWIFTNDMQRTNGQTSYTCMLNSRAGVEADPTVCFIDESSRASWEPPFKVGSSWNVFFFFYLYVTEFDGFSCREKVSTS